MRHPVSALLIALTFGTPTIAAQASAVNTSTIQVSATQAAATQTAAPAFEDVFIYLAPGQVDLSRVLMPAPDMASDLQARDLAAVLAAQAARTPAQVERAVADNALSIYRFADVMGPNFVAEKLPKTEAFFRRVFNDSRLLVISTKLVWNRPRPFLASTQVEPVGEKPSSGSYPSGHSIFGALTATLLANMTPEHAVALYARGREYGENRVIAGVHFPTDVEAGRIATAVMVSALFENPTFRYEMKQATAELRAVLGIEAAVAR